LTHLVWCLRHPARIIIIIIIITIITIIIVMVSSTTLFIVLLALALAWAWAWRLLWSLVMAGHGSPWVSSPLYLSLSFVVMGHGSVRPKASISISSGHGRPCRITAMELFSGHLLAGLPCQGIPLSLVI
jgi:hypothetical protein